jgi:hypothetical protein
MKAICPPTIQEIKGFFLNGNSGVTKGAMMTMVWYIGNKSEVSYDPVVTDLEGPSLTTTPVGYDFHIDQRYEWIGRVKRFGRFFKTDLLGFRGRYA